MDRRRFLTFSSTASLAAAFNGITGFQALAIEPGSGVATQPPGRLTSGKDGRFLLDGEPFIMAAGELHPQRIPSEYWDHRIKMVKAMGFNTISIYDFWAEHVTKYDSASGPTYDFSSDRNNLGGFLDLCKENNMWVFVRPGPFVDAFWDLGGLPGYLLSNDGIKLRDSHDKTYMHAVETYIEVTAPIISSRLSGSGGPVIMLQVENEYTSFGHDKDYLSAVRDLWIKNGLGGSANNNNILLATNNGFSSNGTVWSPAAALTDIPMGADPLGIGPGPDYIGGFDNAVANYKQPIFSAETYSGWDTLGSWEEIYPENGYVQGIGAWLDRFLHRGISFAVYVAHGGTSFGYGASGVYDGATGLMDPNVTSYDYRAPINEQGSKAYNKKDSAGKLTVSSFDEIRTSFDNALKGSSPDKLPYERVYSLFGPLDKKKFDPLDPSARGQTPANIPPAKPMIALSRDKIKLEPFASIWDNRNRPQLISSVNGPKSCESLGMYSGCGIIYSTQTPILSGTQYLTFERLADIATVFLNGTLAAVIDRRVKPGMMPSKGSPVKLGDKNSRLRSVVELDFGSIAQTAQLDVFVYTFGHTHKEFTGVPGDSFRKGIWGGVYLASEPTPAKSWVTLNNWTIYPLPMDETYIGKLAKLDVDQTARAGMFYSAKFSLQQVGDTYVDISSWNAGVVWVNGHNIGRHFASASKQKALFCPALYLRPDDNQIIIFDNFITDGSQVFVELLNIQSTYNSAKALT